MDTNKVSVAIKTLRLPSRMSWYEVDGKVLFPLRIVDGISSDYICYLIRRPHHPNDRRAPWYKYGIQLKPNWTLDVIFKEIQRSITEFRKALKHVETAEHYRANMDGGDLGLGNNKKTIIEEVSKLGYDLE